MQSRTELAVSMSLWLETFPRSYAILMALNLFSTTLFSTFFFFQFKVPYVGVVGHQNTVSIT